MSVRPTDPPGWSVAWPPASATIIVTDAGAAVPTVTRIGPVTARVSTLLHGICTDP
jgi:hypothetical protein